MKKILVSILVLTTWASCVTVEFDEPQPRDSRSLNKYPKKLQGSYLNEDDGMLTIQKYSFIAGHKDSIALGEETFLSSETILKKIGKYYIVNTSSGEYWESRLVKITGDSLIIYEINGQDDLTVCKLKDTMEVREVKDTEGKTSKYILSPTKSQFEGLIEKRLFTKLLALKKID